MSSYDRRRRVIDALHRARLQPYLEESRQNEKNALTLYRWHLELTAAVQAVLGLTEVILRNAMDRQLQAWNNKEQGVEQSWLLEDPASPLRSLSSGKRLDALRRAKNERADRSANHPRAGAAVSHDDVLAQLMFGIWKDLLPNHVPQAGNTTENSNRERLWKESLIKAFPLANDPDGQVTFWRVFHLHQLRNRVSHMEPLLTLDVNDRVQDAFDLIRSIDDVVANWVTGSSQVSRIVNARPRF